MRQIRSLELIQDIPRTFCLTIVEMALTPAVILVLRFVALGKHHVSHLMDALYDVLAVKIIPFGVHEIDPDSQAPNVHFI